MASILIGAETEKQRFDDNFGSKDSTSIDSYYGNLTLRPLAGLTLNGGLRYDDNSDFGHRTTFAANGAWVLGPGDGAPVLRASYGEGRSEEHTSELQSLMRTSYAVFCVTKKKYKNHVQQYTPHRQQ